MPKNRKPFDLSRVLKFPIRILVYRYDQTRLLEEIANGQDIEIVDCCERPGAKPIIELKYELVGCRAIPQKKKKPAKKTEAK